MKAKLLRDSVKMLKKLRAELHGSDEDSVIGTLDQVISDLESFQKNPDVISARDVLDAIGAVLDKLPAVVELIQLIAKFFK